MFKLFSRNTFAFVCVFPRRFHEFPVRSPLYWFHLAYPNVFPVYSFVHFPVGSMSSLCIPPVFYLAYLSVFVPCPFVRLFPRTFLYEFPLHSLAYFIVCCPMISLCIPSYISSWVSPGVPCTFPPVFLREFSRALPVHSLEYFLSESVLDYFFFTPRKSPL